MFNILSLKFFIPEFILSATALLLLILALFTKEGGKLRWAPVVAAIGIAVSLIAVLDGFSNIEPSLFYGMISLDGPSQFFKVIFAVAMLVIIVFSTYSKETRSLRDRAEYYALITGLLLALNLLAMARNILFIYLSLEFVGLISYLLVGYLRGSRRSAEAGIKYMLFGAVASGVFLFGASIYYGLSGSLDILSANAIPSGNSFILMVAGILMLGGFLFKVAAVPMQAWCPDAYEGAPLPVTALLSVAPKAAGFAVLIRVAHELGMLMNWGLIIAVFSAATMTFGNLAAITQKNVKRLLAYSSIAQAGYILIGVACMNDAGFQAVYFYIIAYLLMNLGAFLVLQVVVNIKGSEDISAFKGLSRMGRHGIILSIAMMIFLLSLTGVPPFVGFIGKFYLFEAAVESGLLWLAVLGVINSVISLYYYMRIAREMFFGEAEAETETTIVIDSRLVMLVITAFAVLVIFFGVVWGSLANYVRGIL